MGAHILFKANSIEMVTPKGNRFLMSFTGDVGIALKESNERKATYKGEGFTLTAVRHSKVAFAFELSLTNANRVGLKIESLDGDILPVSLIRETDSFITSPQTAIFEQNSDQMDGAKLELYECAGAVLEALEKGAVIWCSGTSNSSTSYGFMSLGESMDIGRVSANEIKKALRYYAIKSTSIKPQLTGIDLDLSQVYAKVRASVCFDRESAKVLYTSMHTNTNEQMLLDAIRLLMVGDGFQMDICSYMDGSKLSVLVAWIYFINTRNHSVLAHLYDLILQNHPKDSYLASCILEKMSRVLGNDDNIRIENATANVAKYALSDVVDEVSALKCYFYFRFVGDDESLATLSKKCLELYKKDEACTLYPVITVACYLAPEYFMDDLAPSLALGKLARKEVKLNNIYIWGMRMDACFGEDYTSLSLSGQKVMEVMGARAMVRNLKNQVGGCSFFIKLTSNATVCLYPPIFFEGNPTREPLSIHLSKGVSKVSIKNHRIRVDKL